MERPVLLSRYLFQPHAHISRYPQAERAWIVFGSWSRHVVIITPNR